MILPNTEPLTMEGDLAAQMVAGIDRFLQRELDASRERRTRHWTRDFSSHEAYVASIRTNRERFRKYVGVVDERVSPSLEIVAPLGEGVVVGEGVNYKIYRARWSVLEGVDGEGLLLVPSGEPVADVIALPDCDQTPEMLAGLEQGVLPEAQFARHLAENGCRVLVPVLIDRQDTYSGIPEVRMTNQPHREFVYRAAFELGRHIIGYEVQKVLAAVDVFGGERPVGVIGYGEGGLIALYAAAVDERISTTAVCGYFQARENVWQEPIYRNVFGLLDEFGDAEIATLIAPRDLLIEACSHPEVSGPPIPRNGRGGAAPGVIGTPPLSQVALEVARARDLTGELRPEPFLAMVQGRLGRTQLMTAFLKRLGTASFPFRSGSSFRASDDLPTRIAATDDPEARMKRQYEQLMGHTQRLLREAEYTRAKFWAKADASNAESWAASCESYREYLWEEVIGKFPPASAPMNPRVRQVYDESAYTGYEVVLDVYEDVYAYGILLVPKSVHGGERRPVVVCQHGLEGRPQDVADAKINNPAYNQYAIRLAELGFVTFSPQNPYIGGDAFRVLQRKANPLKKSLFAVIVRQHERILEWLASLPFADPNRLAFYGLSYGGKTAMRVPALLKGYCLSICSADYNEWIWKNASARSPYSYLTTGEYEMFEFDLGNTFNYAEMSWLIFPRPFMVERGHHDGVAPDEWVAYEFAKTFRRYDLLGLGANAEIEVFDGPHSIHGVGTFDFLKRHLKWGA